MLSEGARTYAESRVEQFMKERGLETNKNLQEYIHQGTSEFGQRHIEKIEKSIESKIKYW